MERKVTKVKPCHVEVHVVVDEKSWKDAQEASTKKLCKEVQVDGFRKGNVPEAIAKRHINQGKMLDEAINSLLPSIYREIMEEEKIEPFAQPQVDVTKISDSNLEVKFVIVTAPEVELGEYKGLKIGKKEVKVSAKEVDEEIEKLLKENASLVLKEGASEMGDTVVFDFVGTVDGKAFDGGSAQNYSLELGSHQFIPGFEEQLVGVKAGEHKDVNVTFPEQYTPELAGKAAVFACDVHEVKAKKLPELNDEFVKELNRGVETVEALKENTKKDIQARKEQESKREFLEKLYEKIASGSKVEIPEEMIKEQAANMKKDMEQRMAQSGLTLEQYLQFTGQKAEDFDAQLEKDAKKDITNYFLLEEVGKKENLELTDADVEFEYAKLAEQYKMKLEDVKKALEKQNAQFRHNLKMTRIEEFLIKENA
jgi:trigger factor